MSTAVYNPAGFASRGGGSATAATTRALGLAFVLAMLSLAALPVDFAISDLFQRIYNHGPGDLAKTINLFEFFAHGSGVAVILLTVWLIDGRPGRAWLRLAIAAYGAGLAALAGQMVWGRSRPNTFFETGWPATVSETFVGWWPLWRETAGSSFAARDWHSFPSGHAATAAALAAGLCYLYPRGRSCFALLASLAMLQRVFVSAHFLSDVLAGGALGVLIAAACFLRNSPAAIRT